MHNDSRTLSAGADITLSVVVGPLFSLVALCFLGAMFGLAATMVALRFGRGRLLAFWLATGVILGSFGATRAIAGQRAAQIDPTRISVVGTYGLLIASTLLILGVPAFEVWRRAPQTQTVAYVGRGFAAAGWTLLGLLISIGIAVVLDLANVPFIE